MTDLDECELLALRAADGDAEARGRLLEIVWTSLPAMVRANSSMGPLARAEDHVDDIVGIIIAKVGRPDARSLRRYAEWRTRNTTRTFEDWLRIVLKNVVRDYVRSVLGSGKVAPGEPSRKRLLNEFATAPVLDEIGVRPPFTDEQTARQLLEFAAARLPAAQVQALALWIQGASFDEIGQVGSISIPDARRLVRAAVTALRRQFRTDEQDEQEVG